MGENVKRPTFVASLCVFLSIIAILIIGIFVLKVDLHVLLALGMFITILVAMKFGFTWDEIQAAMGKGISRALVAMFIFILIGMTIGSWIHAGTVPALIYYGLKILSPKVFLPAGLILCSLTSLATGTSWGTAGTVGLAMMGIGTGLGIPAPITAGMVISGACFGDKMSPLSDTTNLAAVSADTDLYSHIRAMMYTTVPAYIISLVVYTFLGFKYGGGAINAQQVADIQNALATNFNLNILVLIPMIVVLVLSIKKVPAVPAMFIGVLLGTITSLIFQKATLSSALTAINYGFSGESGVEMVDSLINRGGIQRMMWTFSLTFIALSLGGILDEMGFLSVLVEKITRLVKSAASLVTVTIISAIVSNAAMGEAYLSIILNGRLYHKAYEDTGLSNNMLSRALEEGATLSTTIIPWTTAGAFMAATLGVPTLSYAPYAFLNWMNPLISIILSYMGIFVLYAANANKNGKTKGISQ